MATAPTVLRLPPDTVAQLAALGAADGIGLPHVICTLADAECRRRRKRGDTYPTGAVPRRRGRPAKTGKLP